MSNTMLWIVKAIESELVRFSSLNPALFKSRVEQFIERCESRLEQEQLF